MTVFEGTLDGNIKVHQWTEDNSSDYNPTVDRVWYAKVKFKCQPHWYTVAIWNDGTLWKGLGLGPSVHMAQGTLFFTLDMAHVTCEDCLK